MANTHSIDLERSSNQNLIITDASQTGLDITGNITIEAWFKLESLPSVTGDRYTICSKDGASTGQRGYQFFIDNSSNQLKLILSKDGTSGSTVAVRYASTATFSTTGKWYYVSASYDVLSGACVMFEADTSNTPSSTTATKDFGTDIDSIKDNTAPFIIGKADGASDEYDGIINSVRVWSDIRTQSEIEDNYETVIASATNLEGSWLSNGNVLTDSSGNSNTLMNNNVATFVTDVPFGGSTPTATPFSQAIII